MASRNGRTAAGIPYLRAGGGIRRAALLFGASALFEPLDRSPNADCYRGVAARLLPGHTVVMLGYAAATEDVTLDGLARQTAEAIAETVGVPDLVLGLSFGGFVALRLAAARPDLVRRLVLLSSAHRFSEGGAAKVERQRRALAAGDTPRLVAENALLFRRPWLNWALRARLAWEGRTAIARRLNSAEAMARGYATLFGPTFAGNAAAARRIAAPTLVVGGTADQYFDVAAFTETAGLVAAGRYVLIPRETHMVVLERQVDVAAVINGFAAGAAA